MFLAVNKIRWRNGVVRVAILENRCIGLKSRGLQSPRMELSRSAHLGLEGLVLDREVRALRDQFVTLNFSKLLYNGSWLIAERHLYVVLFLDCFSIHFRPSSRWDSPDPKIASPQSHSESKGRQWDRPISSIQGQDDDTGPKLQHIYPIRRKREQHRRK